VVGLLQSEATYLINYKDIYRVERADGTGDVIIAIRQWTDSEGSQRSQKIGFLGVRNPQEVENMLRQLVR
jgi:hypothetical protein